MHGSLMEQIDKAMDLIKTKYLIYSISYQGVSRRETPQFPVEALRESLMNCVAHKDYADATPTQISVYPDHVVFWNAGRLPEDWTTQKLLRSIRPVLTIHLSPMPFSGVVILKAGDVDINVFWKRSVHTDYYRPNLKC